MNWYSKTLSRTFPKTYSQFKNNVHDPGLQDLKFSHSSNYLIYLLIVNTIGSYLMWSFAGYGTHWAKRNHEFNSCLYTKHNLWINLNYLLTSSSHQSGNQVGTIYLYIIYILTIQIFVYTILDSGLHSWGPNGSFDTHSSICAYCHMVYVIVPFMSYMPYMSCMTYMTYSMW